MNQFSESVWDVLVIGGGAAGMMAALFAARGGANVTLLEKNEKLGKKVYITGKGRCNVTNACEDMQDFLREVPRNPRFLYSALSFFSPQDIDAVAAAVKEILDGCADAKAVKSLKSKDLQSAAADADRTRPITLDIALFGRMVTSDAFRDVEASMQVAHAISTNKVSVESDYFTAMDDLLNGGSMEEAGAGMIGDVDYNASCYYLYASLDTDALKDALKDAPNADALVRLALPALLRAMAFTNPSGKQNSFAGHVLPSCFMVECKEQKIPTSMVNAFVTPVSGGDIVEKSVRLLAKEADMLAADFGIPVKERLWFCVNKYDIRPESATRVCGPFPELVDAAAALLK